MNSFRRVLCALLCFALIFTGTFSFAEEAPKLKFKKEKLKFDITEIGPGFNYEKQFKLKRKNAEGDIYWSSSDKSVADFALYDKDGNIASPDAPWSETAQVLEAYKKGKTTVRAALYDNRDVYAEFTLKITQTTQTAETDTEELMLSSEEGPITSQGLGFILTPPSITGEAGSKITILATLDGNNIDPSDIEWESKDTSIATVDSTGTVTFVGYGTTQIQVTYGEDSMLCPVNALAALTVSEKTHSGLADESFTLTAAYFGPNPDSAVIEWVSSNPAVATVSNGTVSLLTPGTTIITAKYMAEMLMAQCTVTVTASDIVLSSNSVTGYIGSSVTLQAESGGKGIASDKLAWTSSNPSVVSVDKGVLSFLAPGTATITAERFGKSASCVATVNDDDVSLDKTTHSGYVGTKFTLTAILNLSIFDPADVTWTSSNAAVASVANTGEVSLLTPGTATITAERMGKTATCAVTVQAYDVTLDKTTYSGYIGEKFTLTAIANSANLNPADVTWTSSDAAIASVVATGEVSLVAPGTATITAEYMGKSATCAVTVQAYDVTLDKTTYSGYIGEKFTLTAIANSANLNPSDVTWLSSDAAVATVAATGEVSLLTPGTATITAEYMGKSAACAVTVQACDVTLDKTTYSGYIGEKITLTAIANSANLNPADVTWSSDNEAVATVAATGEVSLIALGTATITAQYMGKTATCAVTVLPEFHLSANTAEGRVGETYALTAATSGGTAVDPAEITFTSDSDRAEVSASGVVTFISVGTATVTAAWRGVSDKCVFTISPAPITGIAADDIDIFSNAAKEISVRALPAGEIDKTKLAYALSEGGDKFITISAEGVVTPVTADGLLSSESGVEEITVTVTYEKLTAQMKVTVRQAATGVDFALEGMELCVGATKNVSSELMLTPDNCQDEITGYESGNANVATIDAAGLVTGVAPGKCALYALTKSGARLEFGIKVVNGTTALSISVPSGNLREGESVTLTALRTPADADDTLIWESSNEKTATVDGAGVVKLLAPGKTTITVTSQATGANASVGLTVIRPVKTMQLYFDVFTAFTGYTLGVGQSVTPYVTILPEDATYTGYTVTSSDESIASVDGTRIVARKKGAATVEVVSGDGEVVRKFNVNVVASSKTIRTLRLNKASVSLKEGNTFKLSATINAAAYSKATLWGTGDAGIAKVSSSGKIKAVSAGTTYVYAMTLSGVYKRVKVTVTAQLPTSVKLNASSISKYADKQKQLTATIYPSSVKTEANRVLKWSTGNPNVALVSDEGMVYTVAPGTTYITVKTVNGKTARCKVVVKKRPVKEVKITNPYGNLLVGGTYTLDSAVTPETASNQKLIWALQKTEYKKLATVNSVTGEIYCKKPGTIKVAATAKDGSKKKATITLKIVSVPLESLSVTVGGAAVKEGQEIELKYKETLTATAAVSPALYLEWSTSDSRVASVKGGVITATGAGTATITVTAAGLYSFSFKINVPKASGQPTYRALVIGQYQTPSAKGYLPFSVNCTTGAKDAISESVINGSRYKVSYGANYTTDTQVLSAISSTFAGAKENDVSVIYMLSHGTMSGSTYRWHLYGSGSSANYVSGGQIVSAMKGIKGNVVLVICSCYSGGDSNSSSSVPGMVRAADNSAPAGTSYSVLCSSDGMNKSSYANTIATRSYDFFSYAFGKCVGWDLQADSTVAMLADANSDGYVTVKELAGAVKTRTAAEIEAYIKKYGSSSFVGPDSMTQCVTYYVSPEAADLAIIGR